MKTKTLKVLEMCIENGTRYGLARAYKHDDEPSIDQIQDAIYAAIEYEICEWFDLENNND